MKRDWSEAVEGTAVADEGPTAQLTRTASLRQILISPGSFGTHLGGGNAPLATALEGQMLALLPTEHSPHRDPAAVHVEMLDTAPRADVLVFELQVRASVGQVETGASVALNAAGAAVEAALHSVRIEQLLATVRAHGFEYVQFVERAVHVTSEYTPPGLPPLQLSPPPSPTRCLMGISALWTSATV
ncbi:hypothetical protein Ctob_013419 [Chrysochromulina tobinii]|uniref:Uncharacterized protein n=1 Tax=Chrysochromulina tobinii TaxID=1460289 RepID=A0A0M0JZ77_9EUKA|nr:hypothetical protein Ctob_013419 [Chrysochromulina tobinii]|eukprot:KOO31870.1 hypothetical protein Ctob_013419 [Chrysochromulina sp. CCMP291]